MLAPSDGAGMVELGILGLDTTHPETMARNLAAMEQPSISALWDSGDMRDQAHAAAFADRYDADLYETPDDLIGSVDGVLILTINWDRHFELATKFVEHGIPVLIDKPLLGTIDEVRRLRKLSKTHETPVFGSSALPYHPKLQPLTPGGDRRTVFAVGYSPPNAENRTHRFLYASHVIDPVCELVRSPWETVQPWTGAHESVEVSFANGSRAILEFDGPHEDPKFGYLDVADTVSTIEIGELLPEGDEAVRDEIYTAFLQTFVDQIGAEYAKPTRLFNGAELQIAAFGALERDRSFTRGDQALDDVHLSGQTFLDTYDPYWMAGEYAERY